MINTSGYDSVRTSLFVRIDIPDYDVLRFSNHTGSYTVKGEVYDTLGSLLNVTQSNSELRASAGELTITISGIPNSRLTEIMDLKIKGSDVVVYRGLFNPASGQELVIPGNSPNGGILGRFKGRVMNFSIVEDWDPTGASSTISIQFACSSVVELLSNKVAGRQTNPISEQNLYPTDTSMNSVLSLARSNFNFGAPPV